MADYGRLSGAETQALVTSTKTDGKLAGAAVQALVTSSQADGKLAGAEVQALVVGPLFPLAGTQQLQGENPQGAIPQGARLDLRPFQGVPLAVT